MGKLSKKYRRVKSIDPFYRGPRKNEPKGDSYDRPPTAADKRDAKSSKPRKIKMNGGHEFNKDKKIKNRNRKRPTKAPIKPKQKPLFTSKLPNESVKKFYDRIDREANDIITEQIKDLKEIRTKRKEYLKARRNKMKEKNKKKRNDKDEKLWNVKDNIKFGEVVQQPPRITVKPRKSVEKAVFNNLLLSKEFAKNDATISNNDKVKTDQNIDHSKKKKFRNLPTEEKQRILAERNKAVLAYRQLLAKKKFESKN